MAVPGSPPVPSWESAVAAVTGLAGNAVPT